MKTNTSLNRAEQAGVDAILAVCAELMDKPRSQTVETIDFKKIRTEVILQLDKLFRQHGIYLSKEQLALYVGKSRRIFYS